MSNQIETLFLEKPLEKLTKEEWEALCDGCGLCCINKVEDVDTGIIYTTNVACNLLDLKSCQCSDYQNRKAIVPECMKLSIKDLKEINWLPNTCAYVLRFQDKKLLDWHYLISGDRELVHKQGVSLKGKMICEDDMEDSLQYYVIDKI